MADKFKSTLLAQNNTPEEIQKADLDLLKKINEVQNNIDKLEIPETLKIEEKIEIKPIISGQIGTAITTFSGPAKIPFNEFWVNQGNISYDSTARRFYLPKDGKYRVTLNPFKNTGATTLRVLIGKNEDAPTITSHFGMSYSNASVYDTGCIDSVIDCKTGDFIVFYVLSGSLYNLTTDKFNQFSIEYIEEAKTVVNVFTQAPVINRGGTILNSYSEIDKASRSFSTAWADGCTWANNSYSGNSKLYISLYIPGRINSGTSWTGWYTELQYSINGGTWISLGHSGYNNMYLTTSSSIDNQVYNFLLPITGNNPCKISFKTRHRSYSGTLLINDQHEIQGDEFYSKLIVLEIANSDVLIENGNASGYFRQAFYRYNTAENLTNRYVHLKTNQTINNVMFCVKFNGYAYGEGKPIDATVVGYPYIPNNNIINIGTYGSHVCGAYRSADGRVVLTIYLTSTYFVGFLLDQIGAGPQGMFPLYITDASLSTSATGVY